MKGGKALFNIHYRLTKESPLAVLQASGFSSIDENQGVRGHVRVNRGHYTWQVSSAGIKCWPSQTPDKVKDITSRTSYVPDLPPGVITQLEKQLAQAVDGMEEFYKAALGHLAPQLVMQALDGKKVSWRETFDKEVNKVMHTLSDAMALSKLPDHCKVDFSATLYHNGNVVLGTLCAHTRVGLTWFQGKNTHSDGLGSPITLYIALPQILKVVSKWTRAIKALSLELNQPE